MDRRARPARRHDDPAGGEIGEEVHPDTDQILTFVSGVGEAGWTETKEVAPGDLVCVPAGTRHNFVNTGPNPLVLYTVYGPPEHADGAVHATKEEAEEAEGSGQDEPPEGSKAPWRSAVRAPSLRRPVRE